MTKRLIAAAVCVALALSVSLGSFLFIRRETAVLLTGLSAAQNDPQMLEEVLREWKKVKRRYAFMLKHADADELERCFIKLADYLAEGDRDEWNEAVTDCRAALEVMLDGEIPKPENIF